MLDLAKHLDAAGVLADRADEARVRATSSRRATRGHRAGSTATRALVDFYSTHPRASPSPRRRPSTRKHAALRRALEPKAPLGREGCGDGARRRPRSSNFKELYANVPRAAGATEQRHEAPIFIAGGSVLLGLTALDPGAGRLRRLDAGCGRGTRRSGPAGAWRRGHLRVR